MRLRVLFTGEMSLKTFYWSAFNCVTKIVRWDSIVNLKGDKNKLKFELQLLKIWFFFKKKFLSDKIRIHKLSGGKS